MKNSLIYHGGSTKKAGWSTPEHGGGVVTHVRQSLDFSLWHYAGIDSGEPILILPPLNTYYGWKGWKLEQNRRLFTHFAPPCNNWIYELGTSPASKVNLSLHFVLPALDAGAEAKITTKTFIVRDGETINFDTGGGGLYTLDGDEAPWLIQTINLSNVEIDDVSGAGTEADCQIYTKVKREDSGDGDDYKDDVYLIGGWMDFPII